MSVNLLFLPSPPSSVLPPVGQDGFIGTHLNCVLQLSVSQITKISFDDNNNEKINTWYMCATVHEREREICVALVLLPRSGWWGRGYLTHTHLLTHTRHTDRHTRTFKYDCEI